MHNSILRPLRAMEERGWVKTTRVPVDSATGLVDPDEIRKAIRFHIEGLKSDGLPMPMPTTIAEYVEV